MDFLVGLAGWTSTLEIVRHKEATPTLVLSNFGTASPAPLGCPRPGPLGDLKACSDGQSCFGMIRFKLVYLYTINPAFHWNIWQMLSSPFLLIASQWCLQNHCSHAFVAITIHFQCSFHKGFGANKVSNIFWMLYICMLSDFFFCFFTRILILAI